MKFLFALLSLAATRVLCSPTTSLAELAIKECGELGVMEWNQAELPEGTDISTLRKCKKHPSEVGITSPQYNPDIVEEADLTSPAKRGELIAEVAEITKRGNCAQGGRGTGFDYDYGCDNGWCWRNCDGPFFPTPNKITKSWCWLAYNDGNGDWTPCGRWQDCEWSYNNKGSKCGKGDCKACGCGC